MMKTVQPTQQGISYRLDALTRRASVAVVCALMAMPGPLLAQSFENQDASENIADSEISVDDERASDRIDDLIESIGALPESVDRVKIITNMDKIDVVYLSDLVGSDAPEEVQEAIEASADRIDELQNALQGSAIFYNALDSRRVNIPDVISIELDEPNGIIFVRGVAPDSGVTLDDIEGEED